MNRVIKVLAFCLCLGCSALAGSVYAENRHIMQKYAFTPQGALSTPLTVDFGSGQKNILIEKKDLSNEQKLLLLAFALDEDDVFALQLFASRDYSIYRTSLRDDRQEIIVLGLGPVNGKKVQLKEMYIVGEDDAGAVTAMPVRGFVPVEVLNAPMNLDNNNSIVFPTQVGSKTLVVSWDKAGNAFVASGGNTVASADVKKDANVFNE